MVICPYATDGDIGIRELYRCCKSVKMIGMDNNFTFTNPIIKEYFESETRNNPPVGELVYLHTHPLITPNFLTELETLACQAGALIHKYNLIDRAKEIEQIAIKIGQHLPELTYENGPQVLECLKQVYKISKNITEKLG